MNGATVYEFDALTSCKIEKEDRLHTIPEHAHDWLEKRCRRNAENSSANWLRITQRSGHPAVQVTNYVGVIRTSNGYSIEVLPKTGKINDTELEKKSRERLLKMLTCLREFSHIQTPAAMLSKSHMPLLEVFIYVFLQEIRHIVKRGIRGAYNQKRDNLFFLRGKLLVSEHLKRNLIRKERFFTEYDEFSTDRPANRLLRAALKRAISMTSVGKHERLARELDFAFDDVRPSTHIPADFQKVQIDRDMGYYKSALAWARLILNQDSPLTGMGKHNAPSLLFPMERVFEAYVAKHLRKQLHTGCRLVTQAQDHYLVNHENKSWFYMKPDMLVINREEGNILVLDAKWKLLNMDANNKYGLSQPDFYQMYAYGHNYLEGKGDMALIYPKTDNFKEPLKVFEFSEKKLRLWVLPFCLDEKKLLLDGTDISIFKN